jgi:hypothetical protein
MPVCRPGPVMRKSLATGGAGAVRRETPPGSPLGHHRADRLDHP